MRMFAALVGFISWQELWTEIGKCEAVSVPDSGECDATSDGAGVASKPIMLWAPPRSTSTAFERAVMQHPNVTVFHEHLADCFYFGPDRLDKELPSAITDGSNLERDSTYRVRLQLIQDAMSLPDKPFAFTKELSIYYQAEQMPTEVMSRFIHCFLIRHPEKVVRSFLRVAEKEGGSSTYFDPDECGFVELEQIYDAVVTAGLQEHIHIIDSDSLLADPEAGLRAFCEAVGLPFDARMTTWEAEEPSSWAKWPGWHKDASGSTKFKARSYADDKKPLPEQAQKAVDISQPIYDRLLQRSQSC